MSLIKCNDCGKEVSNNAPTCPQCGNDIQKQIQHEKDKERQKQAKLKEKREQEKERQEIEWRIKGELCPWCNSHSAKDICPNCNKSKNDYINGTKCIWCGTQSIKSKCPNCGKNKILMRLIANILIVLGIIGVIFVFAKGCEAINTPSSKDKEYAKEEYKCAMKSSATRTCSYSVYSNKCVCKTKK